MGRPARRRRSHPGGSALTRIRWLRGVKLTPCGTRSSPQAPAPGNARSVGLQLLHRYADLRRAIPKINEVTRCGDAHCNAANGRAARQTRPGPGYGHCGPDLGKQGSASVPRGPHVAGLRAARPLPAKRCCHLLPPQTALGKPQRRTEQPTAPRRDQQLLNVAADSAPRLNR